jgi:glycosidase
MKTSFIKFFLVLVITSIAGSSTARIPALERVEPGFWWVGMHNPDLQLLVHGDNIAEYSAHLNYPGVTVKEVHKVENPNYLFIDLVISKGTKPGKFPITFRKKGARDINYEYELKARNTSANRNQGVTSKDLIYLIMPDRFANGDTRNDVVPGMRETKLDRDSMYHRHGGDIQGIMDHLGYLKDLGVTTIWCTPEIENDEPHASYHGYAVTDHYKIDPRYGTNELYSQFVAKCHAMGLKVIKDVVHNHCGLEHWFIRDLPMKDWVHQWPEFTRSNFRDLAVMDPHASDIDRKKMLDGWFDRHMPDLNENNPYVQHYLTQNHIWWIEYAGIDGLRLDTYPYNDADYMAQWALYVRAEFPNLSIFGETLVNSVLEQAFFTEGNTVNRGLDTHLPGITDAQVKDAIYEAINGKEGWVDGVNRLYQTLSFDFTYKDPNHNVIFMDNHDMSRFYSMVGEDFNKFKCGIGMLLTLRGIPQLYYGTELLMKNYSNPDGLVRSDFPGGWKGDKANKFTARGRTEKENEAFNYIRKLANYRKSSAALQTGKLMQYIPSDGVYVYFRYTDNESVMVAYNSSDKERTLNQHNYDQRLGNCGKLTNVVDGKTITDLSSITVPAKSIAIYELGK